MKNRDLYLKKLIKFKDTEMIKVITGLRRCGKSYLLKLFQEYLLSKNIGEEQIVYINFESLRYDDIKTYMDLYTYIIRHIKDSNIGKKKMYILLDEIQKVKEWEKAVNSLRVDIDCDLYITGSNAYLLSSELSTLLSGRYLEIPMFTLSFKEYLDFKNCNQKDRFSIEFQNYMKYGGLPAFLNLPQDEESAEAYLMGIYNTVLLKDIVERNEIRDITILEDIMKFMMDNIGNLITAKKISDYLDRNRKKIHHNTVLNYMRMLEQAFILYRADRFDMKGKKILEVNQKYYVSDLGIRNAVLGFRDGDYGHLLENLIYIELKRRGYRVLIGAMVNAEIDFITENLEERKYFQVCYHLPNAEVMQRELKPFQQVKDHYEKILITMDEGFMKSIDGIRIMNAIDFLLEES